jgi:FkbM family methyltransferase
MDNIEKSSVNFIFETLSDDTSIKHYEAFINWHTSSKELNLKNHPILNNERYSTPFFIKALKQSKRTECLLDIGAHHSELTKKLNSQKIFFKNYYLFEPDARSRNYLYKNKNIIAPKNSKFHISKKIISKSQNKVGFIDNLGYCSQIWPLAKNKSNTYRLDGFQIKPDLIKIHTEGTELDVIMGAKKTILNHNPFLVFSVYHRREGFYSDITTPIKNFKNYNWFFRLHSFQGTGAFIYGVPI